MCHMKIYRFEHTELGFGPMCQAGCDLHQRCWFDIFKYHSSVSEDPLYDVKLPGGVQEYHKFGMSTLDGLLSLCFSWTEENLLDCGFDLFEIEVPDDSAVFMDGQVVFDSRFAKRVA